MVKTILHGEPPTPADRKENEARRDRIREEQRILERAARRLKVDFDGSKLSVWNLALALEERLRPKLTRKERERETAGGIKLGRRPSIKTAVRGEALLNEVRALQSGDEPLSELAALEHLRGCAPYRGLTVEQLRGRLNRAKKKALIVR